MAAFALHAARRKLLPLRLFVLLQLAVACSAAGKVQEEKTNTNDNNNESDAVSEEPSGEVVSCRLIRGKHSSIHDEVDCGGRTFVPREGLEAGTLPFGSDEWYLYLVLCMSCIFTAALAAGLTMGMVSLDVFNLDLMLEMRPEELSSVAEKEELLDDQRCANIIKPVLSGNFFEGNKIRCMPKCMDPTNHHYLLVTLLVVNAMANEALPVFLGHLVPAWVAVLISVSFVLVFGEIIPSAIFTGPKQLSIAAKLAGCVGVLKGVLMPIVWPISLALDICLGHEVDEGFNKGKIKALVRLQFSQDNKSAPSPGDITRDEMDIIHGTLDLAQKNVNDIKESMETAKMISSNTILDHDTLAQLLHWGHSRIFVYNGDRLNIRGVLMVKKLIVLDPNDKRPISHIPLRKPIVIKPQETLLSTLNLFQMGHSHLALISADPEAVRQAWEHGHAIPSHAVPLGFLTIEDIFEEMLKESVFDEEDREALHGIVGKADKLDRLKSWAGRARTRVASRHLAQASVLAQDPRGFSSSLSIPLLWKSASGAAKLEDP